MTQQHKHKRTRGCRGGSHLMPVSFRHVSPRTLREVQKAYATGFYTQRMLATAAGLSLSVVAKACRVAEANVAAVRARLDADTKLAGIKRRRRAS